MRLVLRLTLPIVLVWACATTPPAPPRQPDVPASTDTIAELPTRILQLRAGTTVYEFKQSVEVRPQAISDTTYSNIATQALFSVTVVPQNDSIHEITVAVDSLRIISTGPAPVRTQGVQSSPLSLGTILRSSLGPRSRSIDIMLPDSLCAYGHLVSAAQEILLLPMPSTALLAQGANWSDSSYFSTCRAGTTIGTQAIREISYIGAQVSELSLRSTGTIHGAGLMRTDSLSISGTVTSSGRATLTGDERLPLLILTQSEGALSVRLGDSTTVLHQRSTQEWHRRP